MMRCNITFVLIIPTATLRNYIIVTFISDEKSIELILAQISFLRNIAIDIETFRNSYRLH